MDLNDSVNGIDTTSIRPGGREEALTRINHTVSLEVQETPVQEDNKQKCHS